MALTVLVDVPPRDREVLESWLRAPSVRAGLAQRARIVLLAADGVAVKDIVERVGVSKPTVIGWKKRYAAEGIGGLEDRQARPSSGGRRGRGRLGHARTPARAVGRDALVGRRRCGRGSCCWPPRPWSKAISLPPH